MTKSYRLCVHAMLAGGLLATATIAKQPTFSMEATAVNTVPIPGGPTMNIEVLPSDVITLQVYLRNWSPGGELLSAYQTQLEPMDFTAGTSGSIRPVGINAVRERYKSNSPNCFVDQKNTEWIFYDKQTITLVDTNSAGYRWMSVLIETGDNILNEQNDKKYYTGTVYMDVSEDALGTFTIGFMEVNTSSLVLDQGAAMIEPVEFEALTITVQPDVLRIIDRLNGAGDIPDGPTDIDRDGKVGASDLRHAIALLNGPAAPAATE